MQMLDCMTGLRKVNCYADVEANDWLDPECAWGRLYFLLDVRRNGGEQRDPDLSKENWRCLNSKGAKKHLN